MLIDPVFYVLLSPIQQNVSLALLCPLSTYFGSPFTQEKIVHGVLPKEPLVSASTSASHVVVFFYLFLKCSKIIKRLLLLV